uniref:Uncharacterized protein n=1 Tax=Mustela putorius furo TaxID=9669 RepID=M3YNI8_MUSPF
MTPWLGSDRRIFFFGLTPSLGPHMGLELMTLRWRPELRSEVGCFTT